MSERTPPDRTILALVGIPLVAWFIIRLMRREYRGDEPEERSTRR